MRTRDIRNARPKKVSEIFFQNRRETRCERETARVETVLQPLRGTRRMPPRARLRELANAFALGRPERRHDTRSCSRAGARDSSALCSRCDMNAN
jgi:hypothetical protein